MKIKYHSVFILLLVALNCFAQDPELVPLVQSAASNVDKSGVYLTYKDYKQNKLSYEADCKFEKQSIKLHEFLNKPYITVNHKKEKVELKKDSIYAIQNCDEPLIRFQDGDHFYLAEKGSVWIFYKEVNVPQTKGVKLEKQYYFSSKGDGKIEELTITNIKNAFPNDMKLHDQIDQQFQNIDISDYDTYHKMFRVNHILSEAGKSCACPVHSDVRGKNGEKCTKCGSKLEKQ